MRQFPGLRLNAKLQTNIETRLQFVIFLQFKNWNDSAWILYRPVYGLR